MTTYYVNKNPQINGDHEVHAATCWFLPTADNRLLLGEFAACADAVREAEKYYLQSDGCAFCCSGCHKS